MADRKSSKLVAVMLLLPINAHVVLPRFNCPLRRSSTQLPYDPSRRLQVFAYVRSKNRYCGGIVIVANKM